MTERERKKFLLFIKFGPTSVPNAKSGDFLQTKKEPDTAKLAVIDNKLQKALGNIRDSHFNPAFRSHDGKTFVYYLHSYYKASEILATLKWPLGNASFRKEEDPKGLCLRKDDTVLITEIGKDFDGWNLGETKNFLRL